MLWEAQARAICPGSQDAILLRLQMFHVKPCHVTSKDCEFEMSGVVSERDGDRRSGNNDGDMRDSELHLIKSDGTTLTTSWLS